ncbi:24224_t:CDS:2, partial [Gigaspora margarita]
MATSEASDESARKRHWLFSENTDEFSSEIEDSQTTTTAAITAATDTSSQISIVTHPSSSKNVPRNRHQPRPFSEVWDYFNKGTEKNNGHYEATCSYCMKKWARGKLAQLEAYLSNDCISCPEDISRYWREKLGIPFDVIDNPFIRDMLTELNPAYSPPSRTTLSDQLFDEELAQVNKAVDDDLEKADHLTLADLVELENIKKLIGDCGKIN